jgi:lipopolysaccharide/colanic/teichoic acid biosynthesis glycosyltransferase
MIRLLRLVLPASILILFISEALLLVASYALAAYVDANLSGRPFLFDQQGWQSIAIMAALLLSVMYLTRMYSDLRNAGPIRLMQSLAFVMGVALLAQAIFTYLKLGWALPQRVVIGGGLLAFLLLFGWRLLFNAAIRHKIGLKRVLFIGWSRAVADLIEHLNLHPELGFTSIGYLNSQQTAQTQPSNVAYFGEMAKLHGVLEEQLPDWIVIGDRSLIAPNVVDDLLELRFGGVQTEAAAGFYEKICGRICLAEIQPQQMIFSRNLQPDPLKVRLQSMYSTALVLLSLPLTLPLFGLFALLVRLGSKGPVLVRESRVGIRGSVFHSYRFRSTEYGSRLPRHTGIGKVLTRFGLDGLPQIWNVFRGQMSFVGPDADPPEFASILDKAIPIYAQRAAIRPGITGWAQIKQRAEGSSGDAIRRSEYDLYYVENLSPLLDFFVLMSWFRDAVLHGDFSAHANTPVIIR